MKRLIRASELVTLYHGTNIENFKKIVSSGMIKPGMGGGVGSSGDLYFGTVEGEASAHGYGSSQHLYDEWDGGEAAYVVFELKVSSDILLPDTDDCKNCKTWQESAEKTHSVATKENIPIDTITKIVIVGGPGWNTKIETNLSDWESVYELNKEKLFVPGEDDED